MKAILIVGKQVQNQFYGGEKNKNEYVGFDKGTCFHCLLLEGTVLHNSRRTACVTGGWGEKGPETENCHRSEPARKTRRLPAVRPACPGVVCRGARIVGRHLC
jgi:hypothetical protein